MKTDFAVVVGLLIFAAAVLFASYHLEKRIKQQWMREVIQQELQKGTVSK
jgi:hypothetical protein